MRRETLLAYSIPTAIFLSLPSFGASCPSSDVVNRIEIETDVVYRYQAAMGEYRQSRKVDAETEIRITGGRTVSPTGIKRGQVIWRIRLTTPSGCQCESLPGEAMVESAASGSCDNGVLHLKITEFHHGTVIPVPCDCPDGPGHYQVPIDTALYNYQVSIPYRDGAKVTRDPECTNCTGTLSWVLRFSRVDLSLSPLVPSISPLLLED